MKASFRKIEFRQTLSAEPEQHDLTAQIAEEVYQTATNFAEHQLAHRLIESGDEIELSDQDIKTITRAVRNWKFFAQMPILQAMGVKFE